MGRSWTRLTKPGVSFLGSAYLFEPPLLSVLPAYPYHCLTPPLCLDLTSLLVDASAEESGIKLEAPQGPPLGAIVSNASGFPVQPFSPLQTSRKQTSNGRRPQMYSSLVMWPRETIVRSVDRLLVCGTTSSRIRWALPWAQLTKTATSPRCPRTTSSSKTSHLGSMCLTMAQSGSKGIPRTATFSSGCRIGRNSMGKLLERRLPSVAHSLSVQ